MKWNKITEELPPHDKVILCWDGKAYSIGRYSKVLTWKGYKMKIVNVFSRSGMWIENVTHWTYFPQPPINE